MPAADDKTGINIMGQWPFLAALSMLYVDCLHLDSVITQLVTQYIYR